MQKTSPFLEGKWGWNYGESGWNTGMDENLLKFSFLFDGNIQGIVNSLPPPVTGESYFLTTDNRIYYAVDSVWYATPCPKWFTLKIRATGDVYRFDGTSLLPEASSGDLNSRLSSVEDIVDDLDSAAFHPETFFTTKTEFDDFESSLSGDQGSDLIGYKGRQLTFKLAEQASVKDAPYNAVGNGAVDDSGAFQAAVDSVPVGSALQFYVPAGFYRLDFDVVQNGRFITFVTSPGAVFSGVGRLLTNYAVLDNYGARYGRSRHAFGSNATGGGLLVGGGVLDEGGHGTYLANDGHANWLRAQTSINYNPTEFVLYSASAQGRAVSVTGTGYVDRTAGTEFDPSWVGLPFYFNRKTYIVAGFVSVNRLELQEVGGGIVSFPSAVFAAFHYVRTTGQGSCSISGTTVKRLFGQPFIPFVDYIGFEFRINGVLTSVASFEDPDTLILTSSPGDSTSSAYSYGLDINSQISTIRVQKTFGTDEENLTISAKATGEYEIRVGGAGNGETYPLRFYNGSTAPYTPRPAMIINEAGRVGVSNSQVFSPVVLSEVLNARPESLGTNIYDESFRISTVWNNTDIRSLRFGNYSNGGQGGYIQGSDYGSTNYTIALNPKGGNVGINTNDPVFPLTWAGNAGPSVDNAYSVGNSTHRVSVYWGGTSTINTSDETSKKDIKDSDLGLDFITQLRPISFKYKVGGNVVEEVEEGFEEILEEEMEERIVTKSVNYIEVIEGKNVLRTKILTEKIMSPVYDLIEDLFDEEGNRLPPSKVQRYRAVRVPKTEKKIKTVEGKRVHYGLSAQQVRSVLDSLGAGDFGGYVQADDGLLGLRYEEFIGPMIKAIIELKEKLDKLENKS